MVTTVVNNAYLAINEQSGVRRPQNAPLLLFLIAQGIQEQQEFLFVNQLASLMANKSSSAFSSLPRPIRTVPLKRVLRTRVVNVSVR